MGASYKARRVELYLHAGAVRVLTVRPGRLALECFLGLAQRGAPASARPKALRQLVAARLALELALAPFGLRRLGHDLARDLLVA